MDYRLVTDWTEPGLSLDFLIPLPFLFLGIFLLFRRKMTDSEGYLFGSAIVNGVIISSISFSAFGYSLYQSIQIQQSKDSYVTTQLVSFHGTISKLTDSESSSFFEIEISKKPFSFYKPIPKLRFDGSPQLSLHEEVHAWYVKRDQKNIIVRLEVKSSVSQAEGSH